MRFRWALAAVVAAGLALRAVYALHVVRHSPLGADAIWYQLQGAIVRQGEGYLDPSSFFQGRRVATATFPPLYPAYLAVVSGLTSSATVTLRLAGLLPAAATMVLTAVLARRVLHDDRTALVAAGIVAVSPLAVATDMSLMSEVLSVPLALGLLLLVHRLAGDRSPWLVAATGVVAGLGMLARNDVAVVGLVALALVLGAARVGWGRAGRVVGGVALAAAVVVSPWIMRNVRALDEPTLSTTSFSTAVAGANCHRSYYGADVGGWAFECISAEERTSDNETEYSDMVLRRGARYAADHAERLPIVAVARVARLWGAWSPDVLARDEAIESRRYGWHLAGWAVGVATIVVAGAGLVLLRRRPVALATLGSPLVAVTAVAVLTYGNQRFRAVAEPALAILAAWALTRWARRRSARGRPAYPGT